MNIVAHPYAPGEAVRDMLLAVTPERAAELSAYWEELDLRVKILDDDGPDGPIVLDAGSFVFIRFNHRIMRLFWLGSFAMWEGYCAYHHFTSTNEENLGRFREILDCFEATRVAADVDQVPWPAGIPQPGELVDHVPGNPARVGGELAIFGVSWAVLHEIQHLIHAQEGTSAAWDDCEACCKEELSCDSFATSFLIEKVAQCAIEADQSESLVSGKRQLGIYGAVFSMTLLSRANWGPGVRHPAMQERIDAIVERLSHHGLSKVASILAISAFISLQLAHPDAPDPLRAVSEVAERENWNPEEPLFDE